MRRAAALPSLAALALTAAYPLVAQEPAAPSQAREVVDTVCAACHGTPGTGGRAPSLVTADLFARLGTGGVRQRIADGVPGTEMPGFAGTYDEATIAAIVAYLEGRAAAAQAPAAMPQPAAAPAPNPDGQRFHSDEQDFRLVKVADGLDTPWALDFLPDGRMLVTERSGRLRVVDRDGTLLSPVAGTPAVHLGQDAGLFDVAVSPGYARDGWIYLSYSDNNPADPEPPPSPPGTPGHLVQRKPSMTVIVRGKLDASGAWTAQQDIFRLPWSAYSPSGAHYGTRMTFGPDGMLYFSLGDRGDMTNARRHDSPLGKIHRVNPDGTAPRDNPFVNERGAVPTIWSLGHRNPQGLAFDPATGLLWESEHGPFGGDEINVIRKGLDYGWGTVSKGIQPGIELVSSEGLVEPAAWYFPTIAPSGIAFYDGDRYAGWKGSLFVASLRGEELRRLEVEGDRVVAQEVLFSRLGRVRDVATGPDGLLYVIIQRPTGPGTGLELSAETPGAVFRLEPIEWTQEPFRRPS